jgi:hypothetical protein
MAFYCRISLTKGQESAVSKLCQRWKPKSWLLLENILNTSTRKRGFKTLPKIKPQVMNFYGRISCTQGQESHRKNIWPRQSPRTLSDAWNFNCNLTKPATWKHLWIIYSPFRCTVR